MSELGFVPDWPAPATVHSFISERKGGCSLALYDSNNLAAHVGDNPEAVTKNRELLATYLRLPSEPYWLNQVHGNRLVEVGPHQIPEADGAYTQEKGKICAVLTADCLPVLVCDQSGREVAAIHCGWRSLALGIVGQAVSRFQSPPECLMAYLGPAISSSVYEVGEDVLKAFRPSYPNFKAYARPNLDRAGHFFLDLYALARMQLQLHGLSAIYGGDFCTYQEQDRFYSYRRDGQTGRMASLIWLENANT